MPAAIILKDDEQTSFSIAGGLDKKNKPAPLDGDPSYESSDSAKVTAEVDPADPRKVNIVAVDTTDNADGTPNPVRIKVSADARMGDETNVIEDFIDVTVVPGEAVSFTMSQGAVEKQPGL